MINFNPGVSAKEGAMLVGVPAALGGLYLGAKLAMNCWHKKAVEVPTCKQSALLVKNAVVTGVAVGTLGGVSAWLTGKPMGPDFFKGMGYGMGSALGFQNTRDVQTVKLTGN